jgi:hypothetical protein
VFREIEKELSSPPFFAIPLGATLNDCLIIEFLNGEGGGRWATRWMSRARKARHWLYPRRAPEATLPHLNGRIWVTWLRATPHLSEIVSPVLQAIGGDRCVVLQGNPGVASSIPPGVPSIRWEQMMTYDVRAWRAEYKRCWLEWKRVLRKLCRRFDFPSGAFELLSLNLMIASQRVAGCLDFLKRHRPSAIVTEYDRNHLWSCLVLAARQLRIPTVTLVHGVMHHNAVGYSPVLADKIVCWGELGRAKLLAAGEPPEKVLVGGCPRLSRDLSATAAQVRAKLALDPLLPVVVFAATPERKFLELAESFCTAVESLDCLTGVVRLHPSEKLATYAAVVRRHPRVRFFQSHSATLDESLAAADVVVVHSSGVGSDAMVKRRLTVVFNEDAEPSGHDQDLIEQAGCPHARTPEELAQVLRRLLSDKNLREQHTRTAEQYVSRFCGAFGQESARLTASIVRQVAETSDATISTP